MLKCGAVFERNLMASRIETATKEAGVAGRCGPGVRSDLQVRIEAREQGGIAVEIVSRVKQYYGDAIERQAAELLEALGVEHAHVSIHDEGALPFVISARVEAAARAAGITGRSDLFPERLSLPSPSARDRLRRSRLYIPGSEPKYFVNAALHGADAVTLDLEDSIHPDEKDATRVLVRNALRAVDFLRCERMVRINQLPLGLKDLDEIVPESPDVILIPKVETAQQVRDVSEKIADIRKQINNQRSIWLVPILESALGIERALEIASATEEIAAVTIGLEDYTADLGVTKTSGGEESLYARQRVVNAARAAGVQAIDSVFGDVGDEEGLRNWGLHSRAIGFEGMGCVHPVANYNDSSGFRAHFGGNREGARDCRAPIEEVQTHGLGVVSLGSKMIDAPVVKRALKLIERAEAMGLLP